MQVTGNNKNWQQARLTIRVSNNTLSFSVVDREAEHQVIYEPYTVKSGVSMAANLRQAFKESDLLQRGYSKVRVYIDTPVLIVPVEDFKEENLTTLYQHAFTKHDSDALHYRVQPSLNVVAIFPINKDLKLVVEDNFSNVRFTPILQPVWNYQNRKRKARLAQLYALSNRCHGKKIRARIAEHRCRLYGAVSVSIRLHDAEYLCLRHNRLYVVTNLCKVVSQII